MPSVHYKFITVSRITFWITLANCLDKLMSHSSNRFYAIFTSHFHIRSSYKYCTTSKCKASPTIHTDNFIKRLFTKSAACSKIRECSKFPFTIYKHFNFFISTLIKFFNCSFIFCRRQSQTEVNFTNNCHNRRFTKSCKILRATDQKFELTIFKKRNIKPFKLWLIKCKKCKVCL